MFKLPNEIKKVEWTPLTRDLGFRPEGDRSFVSDFIKIVCLLLASKDRRLGAYKEE